MRIEEFGVMHYLNKLKERSRCLDKQVACAIVDKFGQIVASGVNEIRTCDKNCHDKEHRTCTVDHAEVVAARCLAEGQVDDGMTAYVNLFPCVPCQKILASVGGVGVREIVVFGPRHKDQWFENIRLEPDLYAEILQDNGEAKQISVIQGELAELITMISDYFYRSIKGLTTWDIADEIVDAELMLDQLKKILWTKDHDSFNVIDTMRLRKYANLASRVKNRTL